MVSSYNVNKHFKYFKFSESIQTYEKVCSPDSENEFNDNELHRQNGYDKKIKY